MSNQLPIKSGPTFPYTYTGRDGTTGKNSPNLGIEGFDFTQYVDPSGNTWVTIAGLAALGGSIDTTVNPGSLRPLHVDASGNIQFAPGATVSAPAILAANVTDGRQSFTATTGATTLITIPAGRTWIGTIGASCSCAEAAAGAVAAQATATFTTVGGTATPAAGTYFVVQAQAGANVAAGLVGTQDSTFGSTRFVVVAGASSATIAVASTNA